MANLNIEVMPQSIHTVSGICYVETRDEMGYKTFRYANRCFIGNILFYNIMSDKKKTGYMHENDADRDTFDH